MKQETKELIKWIKGHITVASNEDSELHHKAFNFLDSLPDIESHLCKGGYIQDRNGTPCCDGDKVTFEIYGHYMPTMTGILFWSYSDKRFLLKLLILMYL